MGINVLEETAFMSLAVKSPGAEHISLRYNDMHPMHRLISQLQR